MERETGFEPATSTLARSHSTTELFPLARILKVPHGRAAGNRRDWDNGGPKGPHYNSWHSTFSAAAYTRAFRSTCAASSGDVGLM